MKIAICDDEKDVIKDVKSQIMKCVKDKEYHDEIVILEFLSGDQLISYYNILMKQLLR